MANYNKSFNFRNGVQVDDDNFIVNANGLVGIGTSIPTEFLDVHGTAKVTGLVTARNLAVTGVSTFYSDVKIGSGITFNPSTGAVRATAFFGDGSTLSNIVGFSTNAWILNIAQTGLSTSLNIGIGTQAIDAYDLVIGSDPLVSEGISFDGSTGNINSSGIITAINFSGNVTGNVNSTGVSTFTTIQVGTGVTISGGIVTATTFVGSLTGTAATTTNIPDLTGAITSNNTTTSLGSFTSAQLATALSDETGSGVNVFATSPTLVTPVIGNATATSIVVGSGVTINSEGIVASAGIITASGFVGTLTGSVVGIASTARDLTSDARVSIAHIASQTSSIGISTVSTRLYAESIGVGTNSPSGDIHIRRSSASRLQVTSDNAEAIVAIGRSTTLTGSNGALIFGNTAGIYPYSSTKSLDIINYDTGNINNYLTLGTPGVGTGNFNWFYGLNPIMSLTYGGNLGIGFTNPTEKLRVAGVASISGSLFVDQDLRVTQNATILGNLTVIGTATFPNIDFVINETSGISTFYDIKVTNTAIVNNRIGIGNTNPLTPIHIGDYSADPTNSVVISTSGVGIGTTALYDGCGIYGLGIDALLGVVAIGSTLTPDLPDDIRLSVKNGSTQLENVKVAGVTTSIGGFTSGIGITNPIKITVSGNILTFTVTGVGVTSLRLF